MELRRITSHPLVTPEREAELNELAKKIDREEAEEIKAMGRALFAELDARRRAEQAPQSMEVEESKGR